MTIPTRNEQNPTEKDIIQRSLEVRYKVCTIIVYVKVIRDFVRYKQGYNF